MEQICGKCGEHAYLGTAYLTGEPLCERHYRRMVALADAHRQMIRSAHVRSPDRRRLSGRLRAA
jgi:hypothetical protein